MNCPKCGTQNPDDAQLCLSCSAVLSSTAKTSDLAIASLVLGISSPFIIIPALSFGSVEWVETEDIDNLKWTAESYP